MHHFKDLLVIHRFAQLFCGQFHFFEVYVSCKVIVIQGKHFLEPLKWFTISQSTVDELQKLLKVDWPVFGLQVVDHIEDNFVSFIKSQFLENFLYFLRIDFSTVVLIKQIESWFKLLYFLLRETFSSRYIFGLGLAGWNGFLSHLGILKRLLIVKRYLKSIFNFKSLIWKYCYFLLSFILFYLKKMQITLSCENNS